MSIYIDTCDEQNISIETLFNLLVHVDADGNPYLNICDSGETPDDLIPAQCGENTHWQTLFRRLISFDADGLPCLRTANIDNSNDFEYVVDYLGNYVLDYQGKYVIVEQGEY